MSTSRFGDEVTYEVKLDAFHGPIDLLLHLITRQRVDIYDISLATITEEYLAAAAEIDGLDLERATGFLVVAATLLELKSARLLPAPERDGGDGHLLEERDRLLARLVECSTYREAGGWIAAALRASEDVHGRSVSMEPPYLDLVPDLLARTTAADLARAAARLLVPRPEPTLDMTHVAPIVASVRDAIVELAQRLRGGEATSFEDLCGTSERIEVVVRFLALLELFKAGAVDLDQRERFGAIAVSWTGEVDAQEVALEAEEYAALRKGAA
ncbi:MAG: ScpA family protein [Actinomycetota bacterium]